MSAAFVAAAASAAVPGHEFQWVCAATVIELEAVAAPRSASGAGIGWRPATESGTTGAGIGQGAAAECAVTVDATAAVELGAAAGSGADPEIEFAPAGGDRLAAGVGVALGDSMVPPAPDMVASKPSGAGVVDPVGLVVTEAVHGVGNGVGVGVGCGAALGVAAPHKRTCVPGWHVGRERNHLAAAVYMQLREDTRYILTGRIRLDSTRRPAVGRQADHNQVLAVPVGGNQPVGMQTAVVGK